MPINTQNAPVAHDSTVTMSSLEIAKLTGKSHRHVLADIRNILEQAEIDAAKFSAAQKYGNNNTRTVYHLPRPECDLVISGYSVKYRWAIIQRWHELEQHTQPATPALPRPDTVRLSGDHYAGGGIRIEGDKAWLTFGIKTDELLFNLRQIGYELINRNELPQRLGEIYPEHRLISRDEFQLFQLMREIFTVNEGGKPC